MKGTLEIDDCGQNGSSNAAPSNKHAAKKQRTDAYDFAPQTSIADREPGSHQPFSFLKPTGNKKSSSQPDFRPPELPHTSNGVHDSRTFQTGIANDQRTSRPLNNGQLCSICSELQLEQYFREEKEKVQLVGLVVSFVDESCPFCSLVSSAMSLHFTTNWRRSIRKKTKLFLRSKAWLASREGHRVKRRDPRLLLAVDSLPSGFSRRRAPLKADKIRIFIILEVEQISNPVFTEAESSQRSLPSHLRRTTGSLLDTALVTQWVNTCKNHSHSLRTRDAHETEFFQHERGFRLIDVVDECLVEQQEPSEYVALSYVWGDCNSWSHKCVKENVGRLLRKQTLSTQSLDAQSERRIPLTIRNAMEFVRNLGLRFLWVDALCIIQDDESEKARLIHGMNFVYENALFTIIAAAGHYADEGLPGIQPRLTSLYDKRFRITTNDGVLDIAATLPSLTEQVRRSHWDMRGWIYQEQCLSKRCVYFTPHEVFFVCNEGKWRERYCLEPLGVTDFARCGPPFWTNLKEDHDSSPYLCLTDSEKANLGFEEYQKALATYTRRDLTFSEDILNAFSGIFNKFCPGQDVVVTQGLLAQLLPRTLLWYPRRGCTRPEWYQEEKTCLHPSWSWASWKGPIDFDGFEYLSCFEPRTLNGYPTLRLSDRFVEEWHFWDCRNQQKPTIFRSSGSEYFYLEPSVHWRPLSVDSYDYRESPVTQNSPPPNSNIMRGQICFWAPLIQFKESNFSDGYKALGWNRSAGESWLTVWFDEEIFQLTENVAFIALGLTYRQEVICLCVEQRKGFMIRRGIGMIQVSSEKMFIAKRAVDGRFDFWSGLPDFLEFCGWQWIKLR